MSWVRLLFNHKALAMEKARDSRLPELLADAEYERLSEICAVFAPFKLGTSLAEGVRRARVPYICQHTKPSGADCSLRAANRRRFVTRLS